MRTRARLPVLLTFIAAVGVYGAFRFKSDLDAEESRITGRTKVIETRFGSLEYALAGQGPPLLMVHGTGGGFDQALAFTQGLLPYSHTIIAPSRFGYLRSALPDDPSPAHQADGFVELLDHLKVDRVAVAGGSAGALSAVQFALRYPDRCTALILIVPAANVRGTDPVEMTATQAFFVRKITTSNVLFWAGLQTSRQAMIRTLLATDPSLVERAEEHERQRVNRILDGIMPVERRSQGMLNDARVAGHAARVDFSQLRLPTLVISAEDDRFGTAATARDITAAIPHSRLVVFQDGGHVWVGHDAELWQPVARFLDSAADGRAAPRQ